MPNNINNEQVEVMALFTYGNNPCEPLRFKRADGRETKITSVVSTQVKFEGDVTVHKFVVDSSKGRHTLLFNSDKLRWSLL
ncbi:MAG: hypothetical protein LBM12_02345 [Candidatus Nomurabacteria bacterium]|jgi:hypothetical protein|nr:hypothetical protein [Candidatus Nomurabacteria bacterium]